MQRQITIIRKKTLFNNSTSWYIYIDGKSCDVIRGGETKKILVDDNPHTLSVIFNDPNIGRVDKEYIPAGKTNFTYRISLASAMVGSSFKNYIKIMRL